MTETITPLRAATHSDRSWRPSSGYGFAASSIIAPIAGEELAHAATQFALAFLEGEHPALVTLLGLRPQQNLYVGPDGQWLGQYVPAVLRGYPFKLMPAENNQFALGYDEGSGLLAGAGEGEAFFDAEGRPTERIQQILQFLIGVHKGVEAIGRAGAKLASHGLLEPWPLKVRDGDTEIPVNGLFRVNEAKLGAIDDAAFLELRSGGVLAVAYAQLLSMTNMGNLGKLAQLHAQHAAVSAKREAEIESMFQPIQAEDEIDWDAMLNDVKDVKD
jgi:hypothetical protein